jgi:hypothetical protein
MNSAVLGGSRAIAVTSLVFIDALARSAASWYSSGTVFAA